MPDLTKTLTPTKPLIQHAADAGKLAANVLLAVSVLDMVLTGGTMDDWSTESLSVLRDKLADVYNSCNPGSLTRL